MTNTTRTDTALAGCLIILIALAVSVPLALLRGLVLANLLDWFLHLHITVVQAVGVSLIASMFLVGLKRDDTKGDTLGAKFAAGMSTNLFTTLFIWFFGWVWHLFL